MSLAELYNKADYKDKSGMLFNDDCMNILSQIDNESIDLIVTDVPYPTTQRGNSGNSGGMLQKEINKRAKFLILIVLIVLFMLLNCIGY